MTMRLPSALNLLSVLAVLESGPSGGGASSVAKKSRELELSSRTMVAICPGHQRYNISKRPNHCWRQLIVVRRDSRIKRSTVTSGLEMLGISSCRHRFRRLSPPNNLTSPIPLQRSLAVHSIAKSFQIKPVFSDRGVNPTLDTRLCSSPYK